MYLFADMSRGVSVSLSEEKDHVFSATSRGTEFLLPGTMNTIAIEKKVIDSTGIKNGWVHTLDCVDSKEDEAAKGKVPGFDQYSKNNCDMAAVQIIMESLMNCSLIYVPKISKDTYCTPVQVVEGFHALAGNPSAAVK